MKMVQSEINKWELARRQSKREKHITVFKKIMLTIAIVLVIVLVLTSPIFDVATIDISGNVEMTAEDVYDAGIREGENIFTVSVSNAVNQLLKNNPYIKSIDIKKVYPDKIAVVISERKARGYVQNKNQEEYILIDETGMVLGIQQFITDGNLPVIIGVDFTNCSIGYPLEVSNPEAFESVVLFSQLFEKYELTGITRIDVNDMKNIHLYIGKWDILFGDISDADKKVHFLKVSYPSIPQEYPIIVHLENLETLNYAYFSYLK